MEILVHHYGDVDNYGDVLFPRIIDMLIKRTSPTADVRFASATASKVGPHHSVRIDEVTERNFDIVLIAGGEIVHKYDDMLSQVYSQFSPSPAIANPTDVVFRVASRSVGERFWLGLGVPPATPESSDAIRAALPHLTHVSARGRSSAAILEAHGRTPAVIPDFGWVIPQLAKLEKWGESPQVAELKPKGDYVVIHAIPGLGDYDLHHLATLISEIQASHGVEILLMGITDLWNDGRDLQQISDICGGRVRVIDRSVPYETRGALLMGCRAFIGQSMHGAITAMAAGRPAIVVHPYGNDQKFRELFEMMGEPGLRTTSWANALSSFNASLHRQDQIERFARAATASLESYSAALFRH